MELRIIVVDSSGQAERVLQRLKNGEDFSEIAKAVSVEFVTSYCVSVDEAIRSYLGLSPNAETLKLYRNMGDGTTEIGFRTLGSPIRIVRLFPFPNSPVKWSSLPLSTRAVPGRTTACGCRIISEFCDDASAHGWGKILSF